MPRTELWKAIAIGTLSEMRSPKKNYPRAGALLRKSEKKWRGTRVRNVIRKGITHIRGSVNIAMGRVGGRAENAVVKVSLRIAHWESLLIVPQSVLNVMEANGLAVGYATVQQQTWVVVKCSRVMDCVGAVMEQVIYNSDLPSVTVFCLLVLTQIIWGHRSI